MADALCPVLLGSEWPLCSVLLLQVFMTPACRSEDDYAQALHQSKFGIGTQTVDYFSTSLLLLWGQEHPRFSLCLHPFLQAEASTSLTLPFLFPLTSRFVLQLLSVFMNPSWASQLSAPLFDLGMLRETRDPLWLFWQSAHLI